MEMCISRRDGIVDLAQAREKRSSKRALYTRQQFHKKLDDLQTKIKQINAVSTVSADLTLLLEYFMTISLVKFDVGSYHRIVY